MGNVSDEDLMMRTASLLLAREKAIEAFQDIDMADKWMSCPNSYFFNQSPSDLCLQGDGASIIDLLDQQLRWMKDSNSGK